MVESSRFAALTGGHESSHLLRARNPAVLAYNGGIGDRLCNLPTLRALSAVFEGRLTLISTKGDRNLYYSDLNLRDVHELDFQLTDCGFLFDAQDLVRRLTDCDLFLSINSWHTESVSELLASRPWTESVGFFPEFRHKVRVAVGGHAIDEPFAVASYLRRSLKVTDFSRPPAIPGPAIAMAQAFRRYNISWKKTLFLHTDTKPEKTWLADRFERVLDLFLRDFPEFGVVVVDIRGDRMARATFQGRILPVALPISACFALLRGCDLFLGIDSCHLHAADLFGVPGVGLFGPTSFRRWGYRFTRHKHIQAKQNMEEIQVNEVFEALRSLASRERKCRQPTD